MNHLDEGTIHAWLDGALDAEQSRAVEAHIQSCRQCADAVAEARGLVAASTRILGALDDVPANVIPAHTPAVTKRRSMWRAAPWVTGIAAVLLATVVLRTDDAPQDAGVLASRPSTPAADTTARSLAATSAADAAVSAAPAPTAPRMQVAQAPAAQRPVAVATRGQVSGKVGGGASVGSAASSEFVGATITGSDARAEEARKSQVANESSLSRERSVREDAESRRAVSDRSAEVAAAPAPPPTAGMVPQRSALDMTAIRMSDPVRDSIASRDRFVGCYVISTEPRRGVMQELARRGAAADARRPAPVAAAAPTMQPGSRLVIRLDSVQGRGGYVVRDAQADTAIGWWTRMATDSARMELQMLGVVAGVAGRDKIGCPDR